MVEVEVLITNEMKEKLETICNRLDSLENLNSRYKYRNREMTFEITEQRDGAVNRQEQLVNNLILIFLMN
jgi:hypothetical protein